MGFTLEADTLPHCARCAIWQIVGLWYEGLGTVDGIRLKTATGRGILKLPWICSPKSHTIFLHSLAWCQLRTVLPPPTTHQRTYFQPQPILKDSKQATCHQAAGVKGEKALPCRSLIIPSSVQSCYPRLLWIQTLLMSASGIVCQSVT